MNINPLLLIDFYKSTHSRMYPHNMNFLASYMTPRHSRLDNEQSVVNFGLQGYVIDYLIDSFNDNFFSREREDVIAEYKMYLDASLGSKSYDLDKVSKLYDLGYLPLRIRQLPEGTQVPMGVPFIEITNTHPEFAWLVNTIESALSAYIWHPMICAQVGYIYRTIANQAYQKTVDDQIKTASALGDFSFRGQESPEAAITSSAAWLLSNLNTATVPAIIYMKERYGGSLEKGIGFGAVSTEHSVMCSNFANDGNEETFLRRLITELYPEGYLTCVCDSYDYWKVVTDILPKLKTEILSRTGCFGIRGDSGNPVQIVCNTVYKLWDIFGGTINSKGYKVLDSHVKAVYGDSITVQKARDIYQQLENRGFAANNVSLGVGSFSMQCIEESSELKPFTRDTFSMAIKSTYCEINGKPTPIFKDPITSNGMKKSQKGMIKVTRNEQNQLIMQDGYTRESLAESEQYEPNELKTIFYNGTLIDPASIYGIRETLWEGRF